MRRLLQASGSRRGTGPLVSSGLSYGLDPETGDLAWVMCPVCFKGTPVTDLFVDSSGQKWDLCSKECAARSGHVEPVRIEKGENDERELEGRQGS